MDTEIRRAEIPQDLEEYVEPDVYREWQQREGVKVIVDCAFEDLNTLELGDWERKGGKGAIINIPNDELLNDAHVVEIKPNGKSDPEHHIYEETVYIVSGRGATSIWLDETHKQTFEWHEGSLFAIPLNAWYQHFNASGQETVRYLAVTNAPPVMRQWRDLDFILKDTFQFKSRFTGNADYFTGSGKLHKGRKWVANLVPNASTLPLFDNLNRGAGNIHAHIEMASNVNRCHISEFPVGTYKKAHRHGPGAHLVILGGVGFSTLWSEDDRSDMRKVDWKVNGLIIVPAEGTFHQHFNTGPTRARYMALRPHSGNLTNWVGTMSTDEGGGQIEYENEDRETHEIFEAELGKHEAPCRMKAFIPWCNGVVGPTSARDT